MNFIIQNSTNYYREFSSMGNLTGSNNSAAKAAPIIKRTYLNKKNNLKYSEHRIVQNFVLI